MYIRSKLITNDLRNEIRYQLLDLFNFCTRPTNQPDDINKDCIISNKANTEKSKLTIYGIIDRMELRFADKRGTAHRLGDVIRAIDRSIVEKIKVRVEKNITPENLEAELKRIKKRNNSGFISGAKNFFFPSARDFNESDLYTQSFMSILEKTYIFDIIEDAVSQFRHIDSGNVFDMITDVLRLFYSYIRQMPFLAIIVVVLFLAYTIFMIIKAGANLSVGGIAETIAMQHPAYFTAKSMTNSVVSK